MNTVFEATMGGIGNCDNASLVRLLLRHADQLGLKPRFNNFQELCDRCFPFEPQMQKDNSDDEVRQYLERHIVDSMLTALVCNDVVVSFRAFYIGMKEIGELKGRMLGTKVISLATLTDVEYAARERIEKLIRLGDVYDISA